MLHPHLTVNQAGHLAFAGVDTIDLARQYGTPLYLVDEDGVRAACRMYKSAMERYFGETLQWASGDRLPERLLFLGGLLLPKA